MKRQEQRLNWHTPASHIRFLQFVSLTDTGHLNLIVTSSELGNDIQYEFKWKQFFGYRNILEENGPPWDPKDAGPLLSGCTHMVANSTWIDELRQRGDMLDIVQPNALHFVICTTDYVTEVISTDQPEITVHDSPD